MNKFKVGDKVKCLAWSKSTELTISRIVNKSLVQCSWSNSRSKNRCIAKNGTDIAFASNRLTFSKSSNTPTNPIFKVGDTVYLKSSPTRKSMMTVGTVSETGRIITVHWLDVNNHLCSHQFKRSMLMSAVHNPENWLLYHSEIDSGIDNN